MTPEQELYEAKSLLGEYIIKYNRLENETSETITYLQGCLIELNDVAEAADELHAVVSDILDENDNVNPQGHNAAKLPSDWRVPLVKCANVYHKTRQGVA